MIRTIAALAVGILLLGGVILGKSAEERRLRSTIAGLTATVDRAAACDQGLLGGDLYAQRASCSTEVMTLASQREAESRRADSLAEVLAQERADRGAAITRAETRARSETERKIRAEAVLRAAPRRPSAGGDRLVLDAERLRQLGGEVVVEGD